MGNSFWFPWEVDFIVSLQNKVTPILQKIYEFITFFGDIYAMIMIIGFLYWGYKKDLGKRIATYAVSSLIVSISLNNIVMRRRPYFDHDQIKCLKPRSDEGDIYDTVVQGYSFPSGHSVDSITSYGVIGFNTKSKLLKFVFIFAIPVIIGLSRIALGVHYPTDIIAGWILAGLIVFGISKINNKKALYLGVLLLGIIGCFFNRSNDYFSALGIAFGFFGAFIFEEKYVNFENTKSIPLMIIRTIGGVVLFVVLDTLLKLPFSSEFLASETIVSLLIRTLRYAIASFILMGIYPMCFKLFRKK